LIDVACEVPVLLEESDMLISSGNIMPEQWMPSLFKSSFAVLENLHEYLQRRATESGKPLYWALPSGVDNPADHPYSSKLFPFALYFESLETAAPTVLCWAMELQILCSMIDLHNHFFGVSSASPPSTDQPKSEHPPGPEPLMNSRFPTLASIKDEAGKLARCVCQSIEFCHKIVNGTIGPQATTYAQWVLKSYFRKIQAERELEWCLNIKNMRGPGFRHDIELMGFQNEIG